LHYLNDILCKNYNYMFVFAKVIPKTLLVPFFSGHGVYGVVKLKPRVPLPFHVMLVQYCAAVTTLGRLQE